MTDSSQNYPINSSGGKLHSGSSGKKWSHNKQQIHNMLTKKIDASRRMPHSQRHSPLSFSHATSPIHQTQGLMIGSQAAYANQGLVPPFYPQMNGGSNGIYMTQSVQNSAMNSMTNIQEQAVANMRMQANYRNNQNGIPHKRSNTILYDPLMNNFLNGKSKRYGNPMVSQSIRVSPNRSGAMIPAQTMMPQSHQNHQALIMNAGSTSNKQGKGFIFYHKRNNTQNLNNGQKMGKVVGNMVKDLQSDDLRDIMNGKVYKVHSGHGSSRAQYSSHQGHDHSQINKSQIVTSSLQENDLKQLPIQKHTFTELATEEGEPICGMGEEDETFGDNQKKFQNFLKPEQNQINQQDDPALHQEKGRETAILIGNKIIKQKNIACNEKKHIKGLKLFKTNDSSNQSNNTSMISNGGGTLGMPAQLLQSTGDKRGRKNQNKSISDMKNVFQMASKNDKLKYNGAGAVHYRNAGQRHNESAGKESMVSDSHTARFYDTKDSIENDDPAQFYADGKRRSIESRESSLNRVLAQAEASSRQQQRPIIQSQNTAGNQNGSTHHFDFKTQSTVQTIVNMERNTVQSLKGGGSIGNGLIGFGTQGTKDQQIFDSLNGQQSNFLINDTLDNGKPNIAEEHLIPSKKNSADQLFGSNEDFCSTLSKAISYFEKKDQGTEKSRVSSNRKTVIKQDRRDETISRLKQQNEELDDENIQLKEQMSQIQNMLMQQYQDALQQTQHQFERQLQQQTQQMQQQIDEISIMFTNSQQQLKYTQQQLNQEQIEKQGQIKAFQSILSMNSGNTGLTSHLTSSQGCQSLGASGGLSTPSDFEDSQYSSQLDSMRLRGAAMQYQSQPPGQSKRSKRDHLLGSQMMMKIKSPSPLSRRQSDFVDPTISSIAPGGYDDSGYCMHLQKAVNDRDREISVSWFDQISQLLRRKIDWQSHNNVNTGGVLHSQESVDKSQNGLEFNPDLILGNRCQTQASAERASYGVGMYVGEDNDESYNFNPYEMEEAQNQIMATSTSNQEVSPVRLQSNKIQSARSQHSGLSGLSDKQNPSYQTTQTNASSSSLKNYQQKFYQQQIKPSSSPYSSSSAAGGSMQISHLNNSNMNQQNTSNIIQGVEKNPLNSLKQHQQVNVSDFNQKNLTSMATNQSTLSYTQVKKSKGSSSKKQNHLQQLQQFAQTPQFQFGGNENRSGGVTPIGLYADNPNLSQSVIQEGVKIASKHSKHQRNATQKIKGNTMQAAVAKINLK